MPENRLNIYDQMAGGTNTMLCQQVLDVYCIKTDQYPLNKRFTKSSGLRTGVVSV